MTERTLVQRQASAFFLNAVSVGFVLLPVIQVPVMQSAAFAESMARLLKNDRWIGPLQRQELPSPELSRKYINGNHS